MPDDDGDGTPPVPVLKMGVVSAEEVPGAMDEALDQTPVDEDTGEVLPVPVANHDEVVDGSVTGPVEETPVDKGMLPVPDMEDSTDVPLP